MPDQQTRRQRWIIFSVLALMYILVYFYRVSLAVVAGDISRELSLTPQQLGSLSGILFYVYAVAQIPLGPMIDRLGSRLVISGCGVLTAIGGILFSQAETLSTAMAARVLIGIGTASVLMATFTIFSHWFSKQEFGRVSGFMVAVGNLGNLSATAPLALAVAAFGWRNSFLIIGIGQALVTMLVYTMAKDRPAKAVSAEPSSTATQSLGLLAAWRQIFSSRDFWLLAVISFFWYGNYLALQGLWGGPYLMEVMGLSRAATGKMLMFTSLGFISGSMVTDTIARKFFHSYKKTLLVGQMVLLVLMCAFFGIAELLPLPVLAVLFYAIGLAVSSGVMIYPIVRSMFPVTIVGTALTSLNFFVLMGAAMTQHVMGLVVGGLKQGAGGIPQAFHGAFVFPVAGLAVAIFLFFFAMDYSEV
ncbi:membrane protein, major facilitator superfamily [Geotalea daltonii FRC-32]|uniref:Membrane protein, major facilitator superfamily n=1 Tax=Geotalea daltonii (strain DSM 22248 / JCM 15807 / FRC-32) TaxID=316067 RepID=B9M3C6_GEODF|nr:MFS transporter [Geotalea daltonii]ACM19536.1 membrane protein, major facilitator superfamily [Geotalea daltonii FRC-32]